MDSIKKYIINPTVKAYTSKCEAVHKIYNDNDNDSDTINDEDFSKESYDYNELVNPIPKKIDYGMLYVGISSSLIIMASYAITNKILKKIK